MLRIEVVGGMETVVRTKINKKKEREKKCTEIVENNKFNKIIG